MRTPTRGMSCRSCRPPLCSVRQSILTFCACTWQHERRGICACPCASAERVCVISAALRRARPLDTSAATLFTSADSVSLGVHSKSNSDFPEKARPKERIRCAWRNWRGKMRQQSEGGGRAAAHAHRQSRMGPKRLRRDMRLHAKRRICTQSVTQRRFADPHRDRDSVVAK